MRLVALRTADPTTREAAIEARRLAELAARGHEVVVLSSPIERVSTVRVLGELARGRGLPPMPRLAPFAGSRVTHIELDRARTFTVDDLPDADIVLASSADLVPFLFALPHSKGAKVHFLTREERAPTGASANERARFEAGFRLPVERFVTTESLARFLFERYDVVDAPVIPDGVDPVLPSAGTRDARVKIGFACPEGDLQGVAALASALEVARAALPVHEIVAYGNTPVSEVARRITVDRYLRAPSARTIASFYAELDVFVSTRTDEGFELPLLEAMSAGVACVATAHGAGPTLASGGAAILVSNGSTVGLASAIVHAATLGVGEHGALTALARARAAEHSWHAATDAFEAALARVEARRRDRRERSMSAR